MSQENVKTEANDKEDFRDKILVEQSARLSRAARNLQKERIAHAETITSHAETIKEFNKKISELQSKVERGTATQSEQEHYATAKKIENDINQNSNNISPELKEHENMTQTNVQTLLSDINDYMNKDAEFKRLMDSSAKTINVMDLRHIANNSLKNKIGVVKQLLEDPQKAHIFRMTSGVWDQDGGAAALNYIKELDKKSDENRSHVGPSPYQEAPHINDSNDDGEFDPYEFYRKNS